MGKKFHLSCATQYLPIIIRVQALVRFNEIKNFVVVEKNLLLACTRVSVVNYILISWNRNNVDIDFKSNYSSF